MTRSSRSCARRVLAWLWGGGLAALLAGCGSTMQRPVELDTCRLTPFSGGSPGGVFPLGWAPWSLSQYKRPTQYRLVAEGKTTVVEAQADRSASGLAHPLDVETARCGELVWRWKVDLAIPGADPRQATHDDSPARVIVVFDGDRKRFDFDDRLFSARIKAFTGQDLPYATLIYAWEDALASGSIVASPHTGRIRTLALGGPGTSVGAWAEFRRDLRADYRQAFGEEPGRIRSVALMTDADNTGRQARAFYGDVALRPNGGL